MAGVHHPQEILKTLKNGATHPVYFAYGSESYYLDMLANYLESHLLPEADRAFNQSVFYGRDTTVSQVIDQAKRFPMMAERQLILIKEAQECADFSKKDSVKKLAEYAKNPLVSTVLAVIYKTKSNENKATLFKPLQASAVVVQSDPVKDYKLAEWIRDQLPVWEVNMKPVAINLLAEHIGNDLNRINNEVEKIKVARPGIQEIDTKTIETLIGINKDYNILEFQDALANKQSDRAFKIIHFFSKDEKSNPPLAIIGSLFNYYTNLLLLHQNKTKPDAELAKTIGAHPYVIKKQRSALSKYSFSKTKQILSWIYEADLACKGVDSAASNQAILKELVIKILS